MELEGFLHHLLHVLRQAHVLLVSALVLGRHSLSVTALLSESPTRLLLVATLTIRDRETIHCVDTIELGFTLVEGDGMKKYRILLELIRDRRELFRSLSLITFLYLVAYHQKHLSLLRSWQLLLRLDEIS